jgi:hypothetical protein
MMGGLKKFECSKTNIKTMSFFLFGVPHYNPTPKKKKKPAVG